MRDFISVLRNIRFQVLILQYSIMVKKMKEVEIHNKITLTVAEASALSNIGQGKIRELVKEPRCPFVLYVGRNILIKRKEFEKFISENIEL